MIDLVTKTDEELLQQCATSAEAEEQLILRYSRMVRAYAHRFFLLGADFEDLVQEGMIGLLTAIRAYQAQSGAFPAYAAACIKNRLVSAVRGSAAKKHSPLNDSVPFDSVQNLPQISFEDLLIDKTLYAEYLIRLSQQLSTMEKRILDAYLDGLSCSEIADLIHKPLKSVSNALQRIKQKAADLLSRR